MAEAVLLLGHGGPESLEDVRPFVQGIAGGKVPESRIEAVIDQYRQIGGKSPFNALTRQQADDLKSLLVKRGRRMKVAFGALHGRPAIADAIGDLLCDGTSNLVVVIMAPHRTDASFDKYKQAVEATLASREQDGAKVQVEYLVRWHDHPKFVQVIAANVRSSMDRQDDGNTRVIFTAHSVPVAMSQTSNYSGQVEETARLVMAHLPASLEYRVAYQSRSGRPEDPWLEPDVVASIKQAAAEGVRRLVVVPIGFVIDNAEVLYDLDILAAQTARAAGVEMLRPATVGRDPLFIEMLCDLVLTQTEAFYVADRK